VPVDTTGPFPADPNTGQRAAVGDGAFYYYPDEPKPMGVSYSVIQRSPGNTAAMQEDTSAQEPTPVPTPMPVPTATSSSSPAIEEGVVRERKKSSTVSTGGSGGGGISVPWMDIAQGFSAAAEGASPILQTQAQMLALRAAQQRGVQFVPTPVQQSSRDWTMLIAGGTVLAAAGIFLIYALKRK
jgi:hypothetical protein